MDLKERATEVVKTGRFTGAEAVVHCLEAQGIEYVFGLCGHTNLAVLEALANSSIRFVGVRHEQVAAHAADGYFRVTHKPAAVLTTIGPGLANTLTGLGDASLDSAAMIVISGDVPTYFTGLDAFQELNQHGEAQQTEMYRPIVKRAWRVPHRSVLVEYMARAFNHATTGRPGPVLVDVPMDLFSEPAVEAIPTMMERRPSSSRVLGDPVQVTRALEMLLAAERPVIYAGGGAINSEAQKEITRLAEHLGIPVVTSLSGLGAISGAHPLWGGYTATVGLPFGHQLVHSADVIFVLGCQLNEMETSSWSREIAFQVPPTRLIQVDIETAAIGKSYPVAVGIQGDIRAVLNQMLAQLDEGTSKREWAHSTRIADLTKAKEIWSTEVSQVASRNDRPISVERLLRDIRAALPQNGIFLTDVGIRHQVAQQFPIYEPMTLYLASGWGTMGGAVAAALGAKLGRPDRPVVAEVGDGAFGAVLSAVVTAVEYAVPITWVVMNNFGYSSINVYQAKHDLGELGTSFRSVEGKPYNPDFVRFAEACGARGRRIEDPADLAPALKEAINSGKPYVLDVLTEHAPRTRASGYWDVNAILSGQRFRGD
jgi:acetolactate synthase I/II/III large subunit